LFAWGVEYVVYSTRMMNEEESLELFDRLFPAGLAGLDVWRELAPDGWGASPLSAVFHPSVEQVWREAVRIHRNLRGFPGVRERVDDRPDPTLEAIKAEHKELPLEPDRELRELIAMCLWDVFSDNHEVIASSGAVVDIGSFRGSAGFIADYLNRELGQDRYGYLDFYGFEMNSMTHIAKLWNKHGTSHHR